MQARPIHEELVKNYCDHAREDEARAGRPTMSHVTDSSVKRAKALIAENPTITWLKFFAVELGVSYGSSHTIVDEQPCRSNMGPSSVDNRAEETKGDNLSINSIAS